jgi:hypothetical protein
VERWSGQQGFDKATELADEFRYLLPNRITNSQLSGLSRIVQAATTLGQITGFIQHQTTRAARAGRLDVKGYWEALQRALDGLQTEAADLTAVYLGAPMIQPPGKGKVRPKAPEWLTLWMAREFLQHLVTHSLYIGREKQFSR